MSGRDSPRLDEGDEPSRGYQGDRDRTCERGVVRRQQRCVGRLRRCVAARCTPRRRAAGSAPRGTVEYVFRVHFSVSDVVQRAFGLEPNHGRLLGTDGTGTDPTSCAPKPAMERPVHRTRTTPRRSSLGHCRTIAHRSHRAAVTSDAGAAGLINVVGIDVTFPKRREDVGLRAGRRQIGDAVSTGKLVQGQALPPSVTSRPSSESAAPAIEKRSECSRPKGSSRPGTARFGPSWRAVTHRADDAWRCSPVRTGLALGLVDFQSILESAAIDRAILEPARPTGSRPRRRWVASTTLDATSTRSPKPTPRYHRAIGATAQSWISDLSLEQCSPCWRASSATRAPGAHRLR